MAELSVNKIKRQEVINDNKIKKQIRHFSEKLNGEFSCENVLLVGDSKIRHLNYEMADKTYLRMIWRSGANIDNEYLVKQTDRYIRRYNNPAIIAWFGTCELTRVTDKHKKYIDLAPNFTNVVDIVVDKYRTYKHNRILAKSSTRIVFLCVPMYSMVDWNRKKGHPDPNSFKSNQIILEKGITDLNNALRELNAPLLPPQLVQDMYCYRKKNATRAIMENQLYAIIRRSTSRENDLTTMAVTRQAIQ